jgi:hypothetical protein
MAVIVIVAMSLLTCAWMTCEWLLASARPYVGALLE